MNLGSLFPKQRTLATRKPLAEKLTRKKPGHFPVKWPAVPEQRPKDYKVISTAVELKAYCQKCIENKICGFDYETSPTQGTRDRFRIVNAYYSSRIQEATEADEIKQLEKELAEARKTYLKTPLDPWQGEICTVSLSAAPHEARVLFLSHKRGNRNFEPTLTRDEARKLALDTLDLVFKNERVTKVAVNLAFESKYSAKYGKYILPKAVDPLIMWVRCLQVVAPHTIQNPKRPSTGKGLKPMTAQYLGVNMGSFTALLESQGADFFDELSTDTREALIYSAEDSDYALQHYAYWKEVAEQIVTDHPVNPCYSDWLHQIEMPFTRCIGLMEYHGMKWDKELAETRQQEAEIMQEQAITRIKEICSDNLGLDVNPGKTGKTAAVKDVLFNVMRLPAAKYGKTGPSLDNESLIDIRFMLENKLETLDEEKYLAVKLPENWESIDPATDPDLDRATRNAIRIAQRKPHPYRETALQLLDQMGKVQNYTTLLSSHIVGRAKFCNPVSGRIHSGFTQWTETARLNSSKPNFQNIPRLFNDRFKIRSLYTAAPGKVLFFIDFSGFELRLMAWRANDQVMLDIFNNNGDMHRTTAATATGKRPEDVTKKERQDSKPVNFGVCYCATEHALLKTFKTDYGMRKPLDYCASLITAVKTAYPGIPKFQRQIALDAREKGYVQTIFGYTRMLPNINSGNSYKRGQDERRAANTPIQGSAADIMKRAQSAVYDLIGRGTGVLKHGVTDMVGQVHDELILEMDNDPNVVIPAMELIKKEMEREPLPGFPVKVATEASVGYNWGEKIPVTELYKDVDKCRK